MERQCGKSTRRAYVLIEEFRAKYPEVTEYWKKKEIQHKLQQGEIEKCQQSQSE